MNQQFGKQAFDQAEKVFKNACLPGNVQVIAEQGVAASKEFYERAAVASQDGARLMTEMLDSAWGSAKTLNEKIAGNLRANADAAFSAAQAIASAKSVPEIAKLQSEFVQKLAAQAAAQSKEFLDLSSRATMQFFDAAQAARARR
jgi:phasin family protein